MENEKNLQEQESFVDELINTQISDEEALNDDVLRLQNELSEITDKFYRANADFDNMKKRMEKEREVSLEYANERFAKELLPIIDALEEASRLDVGENEFANKIKEGVLHCTNMFLKSFEKFGITAIATDDGFDPNRHNAINMVEDPEVKSGDIVQVYQKGYMYKERVLRASMVVIAK